MENEYKEIIKIKQLPEIVSALDAVSKNIQENVDNVLALSCNEETIKEIKNERAKLNKEFKSLEEQRKFVKNAIMEKYNVFEERYKEKIAKIYTEADSKLKERIDEVEDKIKAEKEQEIIEFAQEHIKNKHLENILDYNKFNINITKSASMKSLKEEILSFIERVEKEVKMIELEEYKDEILVEYKETLDFANSKLKVIDRHKRLEEIQKAQSIVQEIKENENVVEMVVEEVKTPTLVGENEDEEVTFTVYASLEKLKKLKEFMIREGIRYE